MKKFVLIILCICLGLTAGCSKNPGDVVQVSPGTTQNPGTVPTDSNVPPTDSETQEPIQTSEIVETFAPEDIIFSVYTANELIPILQAILESQMLSYDGSPTFSPANITTAKVNAFLYAYAQANAYVSGHGAPMSDFEVKELINIAFGEAYTYSKLESEAVSGALTCTHEDGVWLFEEGETYAPGMKYEHDKDVVFSEDNPYIFTYENVFDEGGGYAVVYLSESENNMLGFSIMGIELTQAPPQ